jgi:hypothetical protein
MELISLVFPLDSRYDLSAEMYTNLNCHHSLNI